VVLLAVEGRVGQDATPGDHQRGLVEDGGKLGGIVTGAEGEGRGGEEVARGVASDRQPGPQPGAVLTPGPFEEVARGVAALQAGGLDGGLGPLADQAALLGARAGLEEEQDELPFVNSRPAA
jgi:hypothetical protein